jgi:hypothetical protein
MRRSFGQGIRNGVRRLFVPALRTSRRSHDDLAAELQAHIDNRVEYLVARGRSVDAARAEAMRRFGDIEATLDVLKSSAESRDQQLGMRDRIDALKQDVRFVLRGLGRNPVSPPALSQRSPSASESTRRCFALPTAFCSARQPAW